MFLNPIKHICDFFEQIQKHSTKSVSLRRLNKGSNCEGKISGAYKKTSGPYKQYGNFKSMFCPSVLILCLVEGGWLKILQKRN